MKIIRGFSEDIAQNTWVKAEVEVDESDLTLLLNEYELPAEAVTKLSPRAKFQLLNSFAELCLLEQRVTSAAQSAEQVMDRMKSFTKLKKQILEGLKSEYVPY